MAAVKIDLFQSRVPRLAARNLGSYQAQVATNTDLLSGTLKAWNQASNVFAITKAGTMESLFHYTDQGTDLWLAWTTDVDVVKSPIAEESDPADPFQSTDPSALPTNGAKVFYTVGGEARYTDKTLIQNGAGTDYPLDYYILGIPYPASAPTAAPNYPSGTITGVAAPLYTGALGNTTVTVTGTQKVKARIHGRNRTHTFVTVEDAVVVQILRDGTVIKEYDENLYVKANSSEEGFVEFHIDVEVTETPPAGSPTYTFQALDSSGAVSPYAGSLSAELRVSGEETLTLNSATDLSAGDTITITNVVGMTDLNDAFPILSVSGNDVTVALDTTQTYTSGGDWAFTPEDSSTEDRVYVVTYISTYDGQTAESQPSLASNQITVQDGHKVSLTALPVPPTDKHNITGKRLYRSAVGSSGATGYFYVADLASAATTYTDSTKDADLGNELPSADWAPPPAGLQGLIELPSGALAGFSGGQVCFSVPYMPFAWPTKYRIAVNDVVAIKPIGYSVLVLTKGRPAILSGVPGQMSDEWLRVNQSCVSKRGVVDMGTGVVYPSPHGLEYISDGARSLLTGPLFTTKKWQTDIKPSSLIAARWGDKYVGFYDNGTTQAGFIFDPHNPADSWTDIDLYATAVWTEEETGDLYMVIAGEVEKWAAAATSMSYTWRSKVFISPKPCNFALAQVHSDFATDVTFKLYADGVLKHTKVVSDSKPFPLPGKYLADHWEIELTGSAEVEAVYLAQSMAELKQMAA